MTCLSGQRLAFPSLLSCPWPRANLHQPFLLSVPSSIGGSLSQNFPHNDGKRPAPLHQARLLRKYFAIFFFQNQYSTQLTTMFCTAPSEIKHFTISYNFLPNNPGIPSLLNPVALNQCHAEDTWAVFILCIKKGTAVNYWAHWETEKVLAQIFW